MQIHQLIRPKSYRRARRVGRGGKRGTYSGAGVKGQKARAGAKIRPNIRDFMKKIPKLRGSATRGRLQGLPRLKTSFHGVTLAALEAKYQNGETVSPRTLYSHNLIRRISGRIPPVKIIVRGKLTKELIIEGCAMSVQARKALERAGCKI